MQAQPPTHYVLDVITDKKIPFRAVYGPRYDTRGLVLYDGNSVVSFYDARYPMTEYGQFVSDYLPEYLVADGYNFGLCLDGGIASWTIDASTYHGIIKPWVRHMMSHSS